MAKSMFGVGVRLATIVCVSFLLQGCSQAPPEPAAGSGFSPGDIERLMRLQQSLDELNSQLNSEETSPEALDATRVDLEDFLGTMEEGDEPPFKAALERIVAMLTESEGKPEGEQKSGMLSEILGIAELLKQAQGGSGAGLPSAGGEAPGGPPGGPLDSGSGAPGGFDPSSIQRELDAKQKSAEEAVWRARAKATKTAVKETRALYEQAMSVRPGPGGPPPQVIQQAQVATKAAMEAAVEAEKDLKEEARRASVPPGWLR